jgi:hypothetical protein
VAKFGDKLLNCYATDRMAVARFESRPYVLHTIKYNSRTYFHKLACMYIFVEPLCSSSQSTQSINRCFLVYIRS